MAMSRANMNQQITKPGQKKKVGTVMREFKKGTLHSGKSEPVVKNPKQAAWSHRIRRISVWNDTTPSSSSSI